MKVYSTSLEYALSLNMICWYNSNLCIFKCFLHMLLVVATAYQFRTREIIMDDIHV